MNVTLDNLSGVILAGGRGSRMGGLDKGLVHYQGKPLIEHVLDKLRSQLPRLLININRNIEQYQRYRLPLFQDQYSNYQGPLAGIASAFAHCDSDYLFFCPCDTPHIPDNLVSRLMTTMNGEQRPIAIVETPQGLQPLCCLIQRSLSQSLHDYLESGERRVQEWMLRQQPAICYYDNDQLFDNINQITPD